MLNNNSNNANAFQPRHLHADSLCRPSKLITTYLLFFDNLDIIREFEGQQSYHMRTQSHSPVFSTRIAWGAPLFAEQHKLSLCQCKAMRCLVQTLRAMGDSGPTCLALRPSPTTTWEPLNPSWSGIPTLLPSWWSLFRQAFLYSCKAC